MLKLNYCCFLNRSGYAHAALDYINSIKNKNNIDLKISLFHPEPEKISLSNDMYLYILKMMRKEKEKDAIQILHCIPEMQHKMPKCRKNIGFGTFETFNPPSAWIEILNQNDCIICPSLFNMKVFQKSGIKKPIYHIPHAINTEIYNDNIEILENKKNDLFTFMFIGTWKKRKGYLQLLEAWMKEFDIHDKVQLIIKTDRYTMANKTINDMKINLGLQKKEIAPILLEGRVFDEVNLARFMKSADCMVLPTLGEGFGLVGLQSLALKIPLITTNFSGVTDYANENTATLIEPEGFIMYNELDTIPQFKSCKWANVQVSDISAKMRFVLNNYKHCQDKALNGYSFVQTNFNYSVIGQKIEEMLIQIN